MSTSSTTQRPRGARESRAGIGARLQGWLHHHRDSAVSAWGKMRSMPLQATMTTLVIAIALALPAALYAVVGNLQQVSDGIESSAQVSLYLKQGSSLSAANKLQLQLQTRPQVVGVQMVSAQDALQEFQAHSSLGDALAQLDDNPLPHVLVLEFDQVAVTPEQLSAIADDLQQLPLVDSVRLDMQWVQRLHAILDMGRRVAFALGIALALGVLLVIGNTIRLAVENRRDEIVVVKLVGGTNGYVRRPFLYTGLWYGVAGGLLGWLLVCAGLLWLSASVAHLSALYESGFQVVNLGFEELLALAAGGGSLGLLGAWLAVGRHLADIEPR